MAPQQRPAIETRASVAELAAALCAAWWDLLEVGGEAARLGEPTRRAVLVLLAHWSLETGDGKHCICWNIGNAKSVAGDGYDWCEFKTTENVAGVVVPMTARFRAFDSLEAGAADYLRLLTRRFARAWPSVLAGDVVAFARALKDQKYYTAPLDAYSKGMTARLQRIEKAWPEEEPPPATDEPKEIA